MNGIKQSNCKFYINEAERMVICVIPNTAEMVRDYIDEHFSFYDFDFSSYWGHLRQQMKMPSSFVGKAVCSEQDEWDEELGKLIAFSRAKDKCYRSFFRRANVFVQTIDQRLGNMIDILNDFGLVLSEKKEKLESTIEEKVQKE